MCSGIYFSKSNKVPLPLIWTPIVSVLQKMKGIFHTYEIYDLNTNDCDGTDIWII
jgi:hypothetical protein